MSSKVNASGLTPEQSKALKERSAEPGEQKIIAAIKEMYECKAQESTFSIYADSAVFHDPIGIAQGKGSIRAQFIGLAKIFEKADIPKFRILENPPNLDKSTILIDQDVVYYRKAASDPTKTVNSLLTIKTDSNRLVTSHTEEWNHSKETTSDDGFFGMLNEQRKKITAGVTDMFVGKEPKN
ncbi:hypothetical protein HWV62_39497 [Athelia sp. TMB]|nr:hypothetical protein HWV62_39497 [Athelia sp. TMB]